MNIRIATEADRDEVLRVEREAFGEEKSGEIVPLVKNLLNDPSAMPLLSLIAEKDGVALGHILFTKVTIGNTSAMILAPLAVTPENQAQGIGGQLINAGLKTLAERGVELVFVLGHPTYYPRHGFSPAGLHGFDTPYPIPKKNAGAWMVQELREGLLGTVKGMLICANALNKPEYWRE